MFLEVVVTAKYQKQNEKTLWTKKFSKTVMVVD